MASARKRRHCRFFLQLQFGNPVFAIGDGRTGLHISSYAVQVGGSAQAASGRDVFLIFDPKTLEVRKGGVRRGITKGRLTDRGCFAAKSEHYLIGDIHRDGLRAANVFLSARSSCNPTFGLPTEANVLRVVCAARAVSTITRIVLMKADDLRFSF
jgi:hypothetical protein